MLRKHSAKSAFNFCIKKRKNSSLKIFNGFFMHDMFFTPQKIKHLKNKFLREKQFNRGFLIIPLLSAKNTDKGGLRVLEALLEYCYRERNGGSLSVFEE